MKLSGYPARYLWILIAACAGCAHAQGYPNQPVKLIVPWPPGGGVDTSARIIAQPLSERLADFGGEAGGGTPDDFTRFISSEIARYADIVKASGAKVE